MHALGRAVETVGQTPPDSIGRLLLERRALDLLRGLGTGCRTGLLGIAQVPDHAGPDDCGEVHLLCQAAATYTVSARSPPERQVSGVASSERSIGRGMHIIL